MDGRESGGPGVTHTYFELFEPVPSVPAIRPRQLVYRDRVRRMVLSNRERRVSVHKDMMMGLSLPLPHNEMQASAVPWLRLFRDGNSAARTII